MLHAAQATDGAGQLRYHEHVLGGRGLPPRVTEIGDDAGWHMHVILGFDFLVVMFILAALWSVAAHADAPKPSPRGAVEIGGTSVVLVAANNKIYAFIDRLEDNAPVSDAALSIDLANGSGLKLLHVSGGQFVAAFSHAGHMQDAFIIS